MVIISPEKLRQTRYTDPSGIMADHWGGKIMTIREILQGDLLPYRMNEDVLDNRGGWGWTDDMIAGLENTINVSKNDLMSFLVT